MSGRLQRLIFFKLLMAGAWFVVLVTQVNAQADLSSNRSMVLDEQASASIRVVALQDFSDEMLAHNPSDVMSYSDSLLDAGVLAPGLKCQVLIVKAKAQRRRGLWKGALETLDKADLNAGSNEVLRSRVANAKGLVYNKMRDYQGALIALTQAQTLARIAGSLNDQVRAELNLGVVNNTLKRFGQARDHYKFVLANSSDSIQIARVEGNVAKIHLNESFPDSAYALYQRSLKVFKQYGEESHILSTELNMGIALFEMGEHRQARDLFLKVLGQVSGSRRRGTCLRYLGRCEYNLLNYEAALDWTQKARAWDLSEDDGRRSALLAAFEGQTLIHLARSQEAIAACNTGLQVANGWSGGDRITARQDCFDCLAQAYAAVGNHAAAHENLSSMIVEQNLSDSLEAALARDLSLAVYDFDIHQSHVMRQNEMAQARSRSILLGIIIALLIVFGVFITTRYRFTRKQSALISRQRLQLQQRQSDLIRTNADLEIAMNHKAVFLSNMSHEIRTPLNAIVGMSNLAGKETLPLKAKNYLRNIITASGNLIDIVNDILDFSKLEAGKLEVACESFHIADAIEVAENVMRIPAEEKGLLLEIDADNSLPSHLIGDASRLNQVLINLLGNAIKFTSTGTITLRAKLGPAPALPNWSPALDPTVKQWFIVQVEDTGIGIPEDKQKQVFESFNQGDQLKTRKFGGTGLGLSISKQIIELQNGRIWVESIEDAGAKFCFALPASIPEIETLETLEDVPLEPIGPLRILIAEDNPFNIIVTEDTLLSELPGVTIGKAENGRLAVEAIEQADYDLILMDIHMPELSGTEATHAIRQLEDKKKAKVLIIAMTASVLREETDNYLRQGMDGFVPKPFKIEQLMGEIRRLTREA